MGSNDDWFSEPLTSGEAEDNTSTPPLSVVADQSSADDSTSVDDWFAEPASADGSGATEVLFDHAVVADDDLAQWVSGQLEAQSPAPSAAGEDPELDWAAGASAPTVPIRQERAPLGAPPSQPRFPWLRRRRGAVAVAVSAGVLVIGGPSAVIAVVGSASPDEVTPISSLVTESTSSAPQPEAAPAALETPWCAGRTGGHPVALDSADPGLAAIAGFENAYYVDRDGFRARRFVAENARVGSAERIGQGIAQIPVGTEHCVLASRVSNGVYAVDLFERRPDTTSEHYRQTITTAPAPHGAVITAISSREGQGA
ncbi:hypothetical protein [Rhodococcus sp. ACT016]|uniref:hypothetical protein n=1 Tax=Rhodococcus sp. ACT016 TaxID=3134808 RepID=UPI003D29DD20